MMLSRKSLKLAGRKEKLSARLGHARAVFREEQEGTDRGGGVPSQSCRNKQCLSGKGNPTERRGERKPNGNDCQKVRYTEEVEFFM